MASRGKYREHLLRHRQTSFYSEVSAKLLRQLGKEFLREFSPRSGLRISDGGPMADAEVGDRCVGIEELQALHVVIEADYDESDGLHLRTRIVCGMCRVLGALVQELHYVREQVIEVIGRQRLQPRV